MQVQSKNLNKFLLNKFLFYGLHLGGLKPFWNPKMKVYMTGFRNNFCVLNLGLTHRNMRHVIKFLSKVILSKKKILFIGAPKGMEKSFASLCQKYGHYYLDNFDNGFFTNFHQSSATNSEDVFYDVSPSLIFFFDLEKHKKLKKEILVSNIPILAFVNTNDDLSNIDYPIPASINTWKGGVFIYNLLYHLFLFSEKKIIYGNQTLYT